jgi:hypothetical protein
MDVSKDQSLVDKSIASVEPKEFIEEKEVSIQLD